MHVRKAIGIDFGGTNVKLALVDEEGRIRARSRFATGQASSQAAWLDEVERQVRQLCAAGGVSRRSLAGIGVGVPGFVDFERGFIHDLTNVPGWTGVRLRDLLQERFGLPARVDNDVNAMAMGESTFGVGRAYQHAVFLTLGTGVGGAILINNKLYRGARHMAGEIGHVSIDMNGIRSPQGRGGLEQYIGNRRIVERTVRALKRGRKSVIRNLVKNNLDAVTPEAIARAAARGDRLGLEVFDFVADCLATALASITYLIQPQVFIIGGGVALSGSILLDPLRAHLNERLSPFFARHIEVKLSQLGNDAGVIGAAVLTLFE